MSRPSARPVRLEVRDRLAAGASMLAGAGVALAAAWLAWRMLPRAEPTQLPEPAPVVGQVLCDAAGACALVLAAQGLRGGDALAMVAYVRKAAGRAGYRVTGCAAGAGELHDLAGAAPLAWRADGDTLRDLIARAACSACEAPADDRA